MAKTNEAKIKFSAETQEFNDAIKKSNGEMSELRSELKLNEEQMKTTGKSVEGLENKHKILEKQLAASREKTEALASKVEKAKEIYGENSDEVRKLKIQLNNAETAEEKIRQAIDACNDELDEQKFSLEGVKNGLSKIGGGIGKAAVASFAAITTAVAATASGIAALTKVSIQNYADYEQLIGGVETLFDTSASKVTEYAQMAYKTAGLSANDYMETVTSFSASLLQSLGGDTEKAASYADMAITDMADNANKMGSDISTLQTAYGGFAKGQFTLLDNLKLGYGGTKEEMQRLLEDATAISGVEYDISSYADIVDAIHVIQTEMGITGTTAKEASTTISGSISSMKASWTNLLTAMSNDDADLNSYILGFTNSVSSVLKNILPKIKVALKGVVTIVQEIAPLIISEIPVLISELLPSLITAVVGLLKSVVDALPSLMDMLVNDAIPQLLSAIVVIFESIVSALPSLVESICSALPVLIPQIISALISMIVILCSNFSAILQPIIDYLPSIIQSITDALLSNLPLLLSGIWQLIVGVARAIPKLLGAIWEATKNALATTVSYLGEWLSPVWDAVKDWISTNVIQPIAQFFTGLWDSITGAFNKAIEWIKNIFSKAWEWIKNTPIFQFYSKLFTSIWNTIKSVIDVIVVLFKGAWEVIKKVWGMVSGWFKTNIGQPISNMFKSVWSGVTNAVSKAWNTMKSGALNAWNGIKSVFSKVASFFGDIFGKAWEKVKNVFSKGGKVFSGITEGITSMFKKVVNTIIKGINKVVSVPFNAINKVLNKIRNVSIVGLTPFSNLGSISVPQIPLLAQGGILTQPTLNIAGEAGPEAIIPLDKLSTFMSNAVERAMESANIQALASKIEDLANRPINLWVGDRQIAIATASANDDVIGLRSSFKNRGLVLE